MKTSTPRTVLLALRKPHRRLFISLVVTALFALACWRSAAQTPCCVDISGAWDVAETITIMVYVEGELEDQTTQSGNGSVTISQNGCKFSFVSEVADPFNNGQIIRFTRNGTIVGNQAVFTGQAVARIAGVTCTDNKITGVGPISSSAGGSQILFTTSAEVPCRGGGEQGEIVITGEATFTRSGQLSFPPEARVTPASLSVSNHFALDGSLLPGTNATFTAQVLSATDPVTYQWLRNGKAIPRATNDTFTITNVECADAGHYTVTARHAGCLLTSAAASLQVGGSTNAADAPPMLTVTSIRAAMTRVSNDTQIVTGTVKDDRGLQGVYLQRGTGPFERVGNGSNWSTVVLLDPGTNTLRFKAVDLCGNASAVIQRTLYYVVTNPLTVMTNGEGSITPQLNNQLLEIGRNYILTAAPAPGWLFSHWSGGVTSTQAKLTFEMKSNLTLVANFIPNPFIATKGQFNGLFFETNEVQAGRAGFFTLTVTEPGAYTASLQLSGKKLSASGRFDLAGKATNTISRPGTNALTVIWCLLFDGSDRITGSVSNGVWTAPLLGDRVVVGAATNSAQPGPYTLVLPGEPAAGLQAAGLFLAGKPPEGDSHGTAAVDTRGTVKLTGSLAEKLMVTQKVPLSKDGHWPLYVSLYSGKGLLLGWINFADEESSDFSGDVTWIKPIVPRTKYHLVGFTHTSLLIGSRYTAPTGAMDRIVAITNGVVFLSGGDPPLSFTNTVTLGLGNTVTNHGPQPLTLKFKPSSGQMSGSLTPPGASRAIPFSGVVLEKARHASGYFLGTNASGRVSLRVAEPSP